MIWIILYSWRMGREWQWAHIEQDCPWAGKCWSWIIGTREFITVLFVCVYFCVYIYGFGGFSPHTAHLYVILVTQPGIRPTPFTVKVLSPNNWTAREFPIFVYFKLFFQIRNFRSFHQVRMLVITMTTMTVGIIPHSSHGNETECKCQSIYQDYWGLSWGRVLPWHTLGSAFTVTTSI